MKEKQLETGNIGLTDSLCSKLEIVCLFGYRGWSKMCGDNILDQSASISCLLLKLKPFKGKLIENNLS